MAGDAVGEKAYYLLTAVVKEYEGLAQVLLRANSDKNYGLNGFLNEILDNLRHLVISASAREIGTIRKEQVINIIDSVVTRPTFEMREGMSSVDIKGSVVTRPVIKTDEEKKKREEERLRKEKEEQERRLRLKEQQEKAQEETERQRQEKESQRKAREVEDQGRKAREERERRAEAEKREREKQKAIQEEDRQEGRWKKLRGSSGIRNLSAR